MDKSESFRKTETQAKLKIQLLHKDPRYIKHWKRTLMLMTIEVVHHSSALLFYSIVTSAANMSDNISSRDWSRERFINNLRLHCVLGVYLFFFIFKSAHVDRRRLITYLLYR